MIKSNRKEPTKLSDIFTMIAAIGLFGVLVAGTIMTITTDPGKGQIWQAVLLLVLLLSGIIGRIGMSVFGKRECKKGIHDTNDYGVCKYCKKEFPLTDEQMKKFVKRQRENEKALSSKKGMIKMLLIGFVPTIFFLVIGVWLLISTQNDVVTGINNLNSTQNNVCMSIIKGQKFADATPFSGSIHTALDHKWKQLDCQHQIITDDLNHTCNFNQIPKLINTGFMQAAFLCNANEVKK